MARWNRRQAGVDDGGAAACSGAHVCGRAEHLVDACVGGAVVGIGRGDDLAMPKSMTLGSGLSLLSDEDVAGFDVAVDDALLVCVGDGVADAADEVDAGGC